MIGEQLHSSAGILEGLIGIISVKGGELGGFDRVAPFYTD